MGLFQELKTRREAQRRRASTRQLLREYEDARVDWQEELKAAHGELDIAQAGPEELIEAAGDAPILLKKGEFPIAVITNVGLVEMARERGTYQGGSQGVSFRVAKGVSYRVGGHRGTFSPGEEVLTSVDEGTAVVTNQRVVFQGAGKTREWLFAKLIGVDHDADSGISMLHVSNRQKASGLGYGENLSDDFQLRMDVALAHFRGEIDGLRVELKERVSELERAEPLAPAPARPDQAENATDSARGPEADR